MATIIETQNDAVLAMREFDNKTRQLKNILMLTLRHSDVELQRLREKTHLKKYSYSSTIFRISPITLGFCCLFTRDTHASPIRASR